MSTKPTTLPRWGATAPGAITGVQLEPSEDKKTAGWVADERPPATILEWLFYTIYTWLVYLADGVFTGGVSVDTLTISGGLIHGDRVLALPPHLGFAVTAGGAPAAFAAVGPESVTVAAGNTFYLPVALKTGDRIKAYSAMMQGDSTADVTIRLIKANGSTVTTVNSTTTLNVPNVATSLSATFSAQTLAAGDSLLLAYDMLGPGNALFTLSTFVTYDRPSPG